MSDFVMQIGADLDLSKVQEQLDSIKKQKVTLDVEIKGNDDAHNLAKSIEKGLKSTKIDTSGLSKQLADAFNITDKSAIGKIKSQINSVMSELGKTWNGKEFNLQGGKGNAFVSGLSDLANSVAQNANIIQGKMGIYDQFYSYFKDKKIYVSDDLKKALSGDDYKELLNNNIGHIVRDASKGVSIDSIWGEMTSMFPEHFADNIVTQADQIKRAFEVLAQARQDMTQVISAENMTPEQAAGIKADAFDNVIAMSNQIRERLQQNIETASEGVKNTYDLDVDINTEKIVSDIRNAIQSVTGSEDAVQINVKINDEELLSQMRSAISQLATGDEPVQVDIQVNKQSLESDLEVALKDVELPIKFKIDAEQMATDIQAAVNQITDVEINLRVNTDSLRSSVEGAVNNGASTRTVDTSGMSEIQNILNNVNAAGMEGQSVFQSFGSTLRDAFSTFTAANLLTDAIYKVGDAARDAVSTVKSLDDATVALQLATGANYNTVHGMMNDYNALAKELGSLTTQVSEGADAWLRQGKSIDEVNNLVKSSMVLSKVGDMSSEDATKYLTASLNGYKLQADAAESVVSKISSVDLVSATDSSGLAEAMSRVAVTADQAGISMDRLLGYVATIGEVTQQSMSTVGTAMKSILTRMTNIKAGKLSLVDEDGTTEKLSDVETTLANVGINLRKTMTEYNSASDVLDALASKWDTMNQAQQNATSIAFGGQRMQNQFRILMQYYDRVQKYTDVAANSEGGGEQKFDLYLQGLESKTNSLKASLESLSSSLISRDLYAGFLDGSKAVVDFTEKTGLLKGALAGLGTAGATYALSQLVSMATSATKEFSNLSNALKMVKAAESAGTFDTSNMASLINLTKGLSESQTKLVLSSTALSDAQRVAVLMGQGMTEAQASAAVASMGLASAETTATGATVSLSSALSGLMSKAKVGVDSSEVDQANTIIQYCVAQKQQLEAPAVMNVDVSQVSGKIGEAVGWLQEFQTAQNTLQMQETLGMDTSEAQANVEAVADKIKGLDTNVKATLSIDDSSIDTIQDSISSKLTNEVMVKAGIDDSTIIGFQETKHDAKGEVDWDNDTTKVDAYAAAEKNSKGTVLWSNDETLVKKEFTAVGHINWGNTSAPTSGKGSVNGTAHVSGTAKVSGNAKASGDWGNKHPGKTLVGELGRELWVDIRTGKWETIGNNGAEFRDIPQGAIVFNHVQTEELLSNGFTASRAVALASGTSPDISGTAFVSGNAMVTGGISVKQAQKSVVSGGNTSKATNATNADTKATTSHTKATEESTEATKKSMKTFDWVATRLETWEKKVKKISDQITDYITSALKTSLLKKQMKTMNYEMKANTKGELAYMKKANSVAEKYTYYNSDGGEINVSIPKKYQKLVQSGAYRIEDMDTSTDEGKALAEAISEYQSWYDKAQDCKQAVIDLRNEQQKLFEQWANMPTEKAEKKIDRLTTGYNGINAVSSRLTAATKGGSTQAALAETMKSDLTDAENQKKADNKALKSAKTVNKKASSAKKKADNKVKSTAKALLKTNLTDEQKKQVKSGKKIDTTGMSGSQKKKADAYNKAVTNKNKANKKATSAKSKLSTAKSNYNSSNSTYNSMKSNVNKALTAYDSGDSLSYMNSLVDQQVSGKKLEQDARKIAVEQANANLSTTKKQKTTSDKKLAKLQKKYKNSKNLTAAQKKKIAAGKEIDTTGITDAKQLKILTAYNNALADSKKKKENVTIATNALAEANENLMTAEVESAQATVEAVSTKFDNAKTYYEALLSYQEQLNKYQEKNIDLAKAHGDYEKSSDYDVKISNTQAERAIKQNELDELTKQLNDGVEAGTIVENSQEWLDMQTKIKEAQNAVADYDTQIEELKQSQIGVYYEEQFERAAEKVDRFRDKLDGLKSLISDEMKIDKNTGLLTELGTLSITLDVDDINASTENMKTYIKERQQIINDYNAGKFGEDEYNQKLKDVDANIKSTTANIYSSRNSILELVKSQSQAELDVLNKVIDKRKEALSAKKSYYDYDKTLKNKTKDIEVLERQIAALEGSTSAEDKARKAKLQEQLQSAKDDLNDTIVDHAYSMQTDSLDKLSTDMSEDLDTWINKISSNMEEMTNAINGAISNAGLSTASTINAISSILRHYGLSDSEISQSGLTNITGYASGTDYVNKSGIYRVNEKGMESVFSKQYGTLTFLSQGDKVFDANFTKQLLDNSTIATQKNMPDYAGMAKAIEKNIQNIQNLSGNTYVNNFYIDGAQDTESILREIDKHLDKKIQAHDKKQVRDFKSLR